MNFSCKLLIFIIFVFNADTSYSASLVFENNISYKKSTEQVFSNLEKSTAIELKSGESVFAFSDMLVPILVLSPNSQSEKININQSELNSSFLQSAQPFLESQLNEVLNQIRTCESLVNKKEYQKALDLITETKTKFPRMSAVLFLRSSINYLLNQKKEALVDLEKGLMIDKMDQQALKLLDKIKKETQ